MSNESLKIPAVLTEEAGKLEAFYAERFPALAPLAGRCFLNTIETTVRPQPDGATFVITGDIEAMWLRDSAAQVRPYLPYAREDPELRRLLAGVVARQVEQVLLDPYANAFNESCSGRHGYEDETEQGPWVWERKYETDSLCAPLYLAHDYWKTTGETDIFTPRFHEMVLAVERTLDTERDHSRSPYSFQRFDCRASDTLPGAGRGTPVAVTGLSWSGFRPSDDACQYGYLIPSNMMAAVALSYAAEILRAVYGDGETAARLENFSASLREAIARHGVCDHPKYGKIYAYETDGLGNYNLMDDANSPSLLAMPYLGYCGADDPLYQNTRRFLLSPDNPYYYTAARPRGMVRVRGMGSPHTPEGYVWCIGIAMQALTSRDRDEILECLQMLADTHAGTFYMHESFDPDVPESFTRPWFAWANALFAQLLIRLRDTGFWD